MKDFPAKLVSVVFHPILIPSYALIYFFNLPTYLTLFPGQVARGIFFISLMFTLTAPLLTILFYINIRHVDSFQLPSRRSRSIPLLLTLFFYSINYFTLWRMSDIVPAVIAQFYLVTVIIVLLNLTINFKTKISSHMLALGGFVGYAFVFHSLMNVAGFVPILVFVLVSAITAAARLKLNAHTPTQIYMGFFVGLLTGLAAYLLF